MTRDTLLRVMQILFTTAVIELRAFGARVGTRTLPMSGYYDDAYALAHRAEALDQAGAESICVTLNELDPALLARSANVLRVAARGATTCDGEVRRRRYVLLDFDAMRPSGISATDGEHALALQRASDARAWLARFGIGSILADSGNGGHVVVPVDQPNDAAALAVITGFTKAVAFQFDDAHVKVDLTTVNAARVVKLYGTMARKGSDMPDRPHRRSALLDVPSLLTPVPANVLQDIASRLPSRPTAVAMSSNQPFDVAGWLAAHQLVVASQGEWNGHYKFVLETCPFEAAHTNRSAYVIHMSSGAIAAGCHHASCADKTWRDVRALYDTRPAVPVTPLPPSRQWPAPLEAAAFTGLAGTLSG